MDAANPMAMLQGAGMVSIIIGVIIGLAIASGLLLLGMKIVNVEGRSFWKALGVIVLSWIVSLIVSFVLGMILGPGFLTGILNLIVSLLVIAGFITLFCKSSYGRSLGAAALYWVFLIILGIIVAVLAFSLGLAAA